MTDVFANFDFALLDDPDFREDSVREEVVVPLLAALGYSASPPHKIIRSMRLEHPYVYIGSVKKPITIIPDYLLQRDGENAWILDAKGPGEDISSGKHVEQAYSYAVHKDIRVPLYGLCNGRRLVVFHISQWPAILDIPVRDLKSQWLMILDLLGSRAAWPQGLRPGFLPDFGLALLKAGLAVDEKDGKKIYQMFTSIPVQSVAKAEDGLYVVTGFICWEDVAYYMITFDINPEQYAKFLDTLEQTARELISSALTRQPYSIHLKAEELQELPCIAVVANVGDRVFTNNNESYCPFEIEEFF